MKTKKEIFHLYFKSEPSTRADRILYVITVIISMILLAGGYSFAVHGGTVLGQNLGGIQSEAYRARITEVISSNDIYSQYSDSIAERRTVCYATLLSGPDEGKQILVTQVQDTTTLTLSDPCKEGDKLYVYQQENEYGEMQWYTSGYIRSDWLALLTGLFILLVLVFGGMKGVRTLISLALTCLAIFAVLIPMIAAGYNIYLTSIGVCLFTIIMTLALVSGWRIKSLAAGIGCAGGVLIAGLITLISEYQMRMTGLVDDDSMMLLFINEQHPIDLKGIVFAAIIIGAVGATMDVGMDIASSLTELYCQNPDIRALSLMRSGFTIGRDIMGTMSNTLVLAYIGSGLHVTLLFMTYYDNLEKVLSVEMITGEVLQALAGSIGIVFTIPVTTFATVFLYYITRKRRRHRLAKTAVSTVDPQSDASQVSDSGETPANMPSPVSDEPKTDLSSPPNSPPDSPPRTLRSPDEVPFLRNAGTEQHSVPPFRR